MLCTHGQTLANNISALAQQWTNVSSNIDKRWPNRGFVHGNNLYLFFYSLFFPNVSSKVVVQLHTQVILQLH
jgi:hypothetical protein